MQTFESTLHARSRLANMVAKTVSALAVAVVLAPAAHAADTLFNFSLSDAAGDSFVGTISVDTSVPDVDFITGFTLNLTGCNGFCSSTYSSADPGSNFSGAYQGLGTQPGTWVVANNLTFNLDGHRAIVFNAIWDTPTPTVSFFKDNVLLATSALLDTTPGTRLDGFGGFVFATAPVPEPGTYALMLAGMGAMGFVVKRRKAA